MTIPKGTLFPMCDMNLGFNRELIGHAMYFGLMGDNQPIDRDSTRFHKDSTRYGGVCSGFGGLGNGT
ncbi:hypothetical protein RJ640_022512 [Escallonia rubra]|uniref:Uncharacterized protein n=1 Tax=Escallonia rubra TaxID=112253 RepID=A0AA88RE80_9ASTE|nr:hypothetical protein RJ640_022512 [Escallonia rubra]